MNNEGNLLSPIAGVLSISGPRVVSSAIKCHHQGHSFLETLHSITLSTWLVYIILG